MAKEKLTHKEEIANRRAIAANILAEQKKREKRSKIAMWSTFGTVFVGIAVAVTLVIVSSVQNKLDVSETAPKAMTSNGAIFTSLTDVVKGNGYNLETEKGVESKSLLSDSKVPHIELYIDYDCPHCKDFEEANSGFLKTLLADKKATVEYKPIVVIGSNLSISGANAAACVAENSPERFLDLNDKLFAQGGQQNVSVSKVVKEMGISEQVEKCVTDKVFSKWVTKASEQALDRTDATEKQMVQGTPTVIVDGVKYPYAPQQFSMFMNTMIGGELTVEETIAQLEAQSSGAEQETSAAPGAEQ